MNESLVLLSWLLNLPIVDFGEFMHKNPILPCGLGRLQSFYPTTLIEIAVSNFVLSQVQGCPLIELVVSSSQTPFLESRLNNPKISRKSN